MIVVLSYNEFEQGAEGVIDWLVHLNADFIKITMSDLYLSNRDLVLDVNKRELLYKGRNILDEVNVIFYRRIYDKFKIEDSIRNPFKEKLEELVTNESSVLLNYLVHLLQDKIWFPKMSGAHISKLIQLNIAARCGLTVPQTCVINSRDRLREFYDRCGGDVITKPVSHGAYFIASRTTYYPYVQKLTEEAIEDLPEYFFPSLFQEKVEKDVEIRVFYLDGEFYNLALMVGNTGQLVDIKEYSDHDHLHWVPYRLPAEFAARLDKFMRAVDLNTGSLDIIRTVDGQYVFLEVNPVGQYGHGSHYGNFGLERKIAQWLINKDKKYE